MTTEFITKPAAGLFTRLTSNPHTSIAAVVWFGASAISKLGAIWMPAHADQFKQTTDAIKDLAMTYGMVMAGDAPKSSGQPAPPPAS